MRYLWLLAPVVMWAGPARYARLGDFQGSVEIQTRAGEPWMAAERNLPLPESAWVRTGAGSRAEIELDEGSVARLGPNSQIELSDYARLSTGQRVTLLSLDHGVAYITGQPEGRDALALAVPGAQVTFTRLARVRLEVEEQWSQIALLSGAARFSSPAADIELREGQTTRVEPANSARFFFYKEVLPRELDPWSQERDDLRAASTSAAHVVQRYGLLDLDTAGEWIVTKDLGPVWRPKAAEAWLPFQNGRWRWFDGLGYTWISDDSWGWLPYHYGRWTRLDNLGWVWAPSKNGVFKPGEVYWLRGAGLVGWGPLAPGESWDPADAVSPVPAQFLNAHTTYAAARPMALVLDPAGLAARPEDPLQDFEFLAALPSPAFPAAKLDAVRALVNATNLRVKPVVEGMTADAAPRSSYPQPVVPPPPAPLVIVTEGAPAPPADPEVIAVPVPVPSGIVFVGSRTAPRTAAKPVAAAPTPPALVTAAARHDKGGRPPAPAKKFKNAAESSLVNGIVKELDAHDFQKAAADLDSWKDHFHDTEYADDRLYYYMLAYHGLNQPAKVVDVGGPLVLKPVTEAFEDAMQSLSVLYLAATNFQKLVKPTRDQGAVGRAAARELLEILPACFTAEHRPPVMSAADWAKSRTDLESLARETLARTSR